MSCLPNLIIDLNLIKNLIHFSIVFRLVLLIGFSKLGTDPVYPSEYRVSISRRMHSSYLCQLCLQLFNAGFGFIGSALGFIGSLPLGLRVFAFFFPAFFPQLFFSFPATTIYLWLIFLPSS